MQENRPADYVVPVISEEVHTDAVPVETGGVRVIKRVEGHDEIVEQELRKGHVEVRRVAINRAVDGPQQARREGNTLIVPVVSEVLKIEKHWVVTEEIHITQLEERERVAEKVSVNHEVVEVQHLDEHGNSVGTVAPPRSAGQVLPRQDTAIPERRILSGGQDSMVKK